MLQLRGDPRREDTQRLRTRLVDMVVQFRDQTSDGSGPPVLSDRDFRAEGEADCDRRLEELERTKADWDRFQSDACYVEDDGRVA